MSEILICIKGSFDLKCIEHEEKNFTLTENEAIYIPKMVWIEFNNFKNCIILKIV